MVTVVNCEGAYVTRKHAGVRVQTVCHAKGTGNPFRGQLVFSYLKRSSASFRTTAKPCFSVAFSVFLTNHRVRIST
jgi:hypothetical protein